MPGPRATWRSRWARGTKSAPITSQPGAARSGAVASCSAAEVERAAWCPALGQLGQLRGGRASHRVPRSGTPDSSRESIVVASIFLTSQVPLLLSSIVARYTRVKWQHQDTVTMTARLQAVRARAGPDAVRAGQRRGHQPRRPRRAGVSRGDRPAHPAAARGTAGADLGRDHHAGRPARTRAGGYNGARIRGTAGRCWSSCSRRPSSPPHPAWPRTTRGSRARGRHSRRAPGSHRGLPAGCRRRRCRRGRRPSPSACPGTRGVRKAPQRDKACDAITYSHQDQVGMPLWRYCSHQAV